MRTLYNENYEAFLSLFTDGMKSKSLQVLLENLFLGTPFDVSAYLNDSKKLLTLSTLIYTRIIKSQRKEMQPNLSKKFNLDLAFGLSHPYINLNFTPLSANEQEILKQCEQQYSDETLIFIHPITQKLYAKSWLKSLYAYIQELTETENCGLQNVTKCKLMLFTLRDKQMNQIHI